MESDRFDDVARELAPLLSRRGLAGLLGLAAVGPASVIEAGKRRRKRKRKKKNKGKNDDKTPQPVVKLNAFGCVNVAEFCESAAQCCSGICENAKCQAHDVDVCQTTQTTTFCVEGATNAACTGPAGAEGLCFTSTGNAGVCGTDLQCVACQKDADCQAASICGPGAACAVCPGCLDTGGTACVATGAAGCS